MFKEVMDFIVQYQDAIYAIIVIVAGAFGVGRKQAKQMAIQMVKDSKQMFVGTMQKDSGKFATYIYNKLPAKVKPFVSEATVKKLIDESIVFIEKEVQATVDIKK